MVHQGVRERLRPPVVELVHAVPRRLLFFRMFSGKWNAFRNSAVPSSYTQIARRSRSFGAGVSGNDARGPSENSKRPLWDERDILKFAKFFCFAKMCLHRVSNPLPIDR